MDAKCMPSYYSWNLKNLTNGTKPILPCERSHHKKMLLFCKLRPYHVISCHWKKEQKRHVSQEQKGKTPAECHVQWTGKKATVLPKQKGTIAGAVALIIGTSIGSGILALPKKAYPAGLFPSSITMILCWLFLLGEALILAEINVGLRRKNKMTEEEYELDIISIRTMAKETLGEWGGMFATIIYVFLGYTSMIAYSSKSGEILFHWINLPASVSSCIFTALFTVLIVIGGTRATDQVNQWLTSSMIGLLLAIEVLAVVFGGWTGFEGSDDWGNVPATIPVMIFTLVYHDLVPVLCAYLGGDLKRIRTSLLLGSLLPLISLLVWDAIALSISAQADHIADPVDVLMRVRWSGVPFMVQAFSLLAIGTSLIGTLLGFSEFFKEQFNNLSNSSLVPKMQDVQMGSRKLLGLEKWWKRNKVSFAATAMVVTPSLLVSTTVPSAFSAATDFAGGYCMTMLYGVLPPAMAWAMYDSKTNQNIDRKAISQAKPALVGVGLVAWVIVVEQLVQDFLALQL